MAEQEYYEDEFDEMEDGAQGYDDTEESSLAAALGAQMKSAPWYMGSVLFHALLFGILVLLPHEAETKKKRTKVIRTSIEEEPVEEIEEIEPDEPEDEVVESDTPTEVSSVAPSVEVTTDVEISADVEVDADDSSDEPSEEEAMGDIGADDLGGTPVLGMSSSRSSKGGGKFGFRAAGSGRKKALRRGGGGRDTEKAVNDALNWLAHHQDPDGSWDPGKYEGSRTWKVGVTSLGLLAFLGAGNSSKAGKYRNNVKRATEFLMKQQKPNGIVGSHRYEAGIALMALSEAYGMSNDRRIKVAAEKIGKYCADTQSSTGGWEYSPTPNDSDSSVTGWYVMGLKSAKVAGIDIENKVYEQALKMFHYGTAANGTCFYKTKNIKSPKGIKPGGNATLGAVSLTCLQFLGRPRDDEKVVACAERSAKMLPDPNNRHLNYYLHYYQALGLFQMGTKSSYWRTFNPPMKKKYIKMQIKEGDYSENKGSWPPEREVDHHGPHWSRVGTTAIACLTLQVYYRYKELH